MQNVELARLVQEDLEESLAELERMRDNVGPGPQGREYSLAITGLEEVLWRFERGMNLATAPPKVHRGFSIPRAIR